MIAIVNQHKGIGKICQYEVKFSNHLYHFFIAFGVKGEDIMRHRLEDSGNILCYREDNDLKALLEDYMGEGVTKMNKVWG